jgi:hypothetical protein
MCARHSHWYEHLPKMLGMPCPEDALSLQETLARAVAMVMAKEIDAPTAQAVANLCRIMRQNLADCVRELEREDWENWDTPNTVM